MPARASRGSIALGAFVPSLWLNASDLLAYDREVGRMPAITWQVQFWGDSPAAARFDGSRLNLIRSHGAMPMVSWQPSVRPARIDQPDYSWRAIAAGKHDAYIRRWARDARAYGHPVAVRLMHEMNGNWYPWGAGVNGNNKPADFTAAWRHIVDIFRQVGAANVHFVWCISAGKFAANADAYYPGDAYVDWVGVDVYNLGGRLWKPFSQLFGPVYTKLTELTKKPIMIAEIGSPEQSIPGGQSKAQWIEQAFLVDMPQRYPRVRAVLWFNYDMPGRFDLRVNSSPASLTAFRLVASSPYYRGRMAMGPGVTSRPISRAGGHRAVSIQHVRVQTSPKPQWGRPPATRRLRVKQPVNLAVYVAVTGAQADGTLDITWRVTGPQQFVATRRRTLRVRQVPRHRIFAYWRIIPRVAGHYTLQVSVTAGGSRQSSSLRFFVDGRPA